ncbi:MAG: hypothetical protein R3325_02410 [Thermoanaerobaculia bacterium]|nr:hypothetical protein [Thermoanaerobaculia bacterium]
MSVRTFGRLALAAALGGLLLLAWAATSGPPRPSPLPSHSFAFGAVADVPYYPWETLKYRVALADMEQHELEWVLVAGDIFWRPCVEERYRRSLDWFAALAHPVVYTPGDNEWTDCWEPGSGGFAPLDRLALLRRLFFTGARVGLGRGELPLISQADGGGPLAGFAENARWSHRGLLFATLHLVGSRNATERFPSRTADDDREVERRTRAATEWMRAAFAEARADGSSAVVLAFHANPAFESPPGDAYRSSYEPFLTALEEEVAAFAGPVLAVHGDDHEYLLDRPLRHRATGERLDNFLRLQLPGSPEVAWVRVVVTPGAAEPFAFEKRPVPAYKYF